MALDFSKLTGTYNYKQRQSQNLTAEIEDHAKITNEDDLMLIGFGGTISSGYSPQSKSIYPLNPSPAIKQVEYIKLFGIHEVKYQRLDMAAKDSRDLETEDIFQLLDALTAIHNKTCLITTGTYMLPKIAALIKTELPALNKVVGLTGSILPAGFMASDADANVWSAITTVLQTQKQKQHTNLDVQLVFHGKVYEKLDELQTLDLHPPKTQKIVIQYPLSTVKADYQRD